MKKDFMKIVSTFSVLLLCSMMSLAQVTTIKQALDAIPYSNPPYRNTKMIPFPILGEFPSSISDISDKLYVDLQCTMFIRASKSEDLSPSLYLKIKLPNSNNILGALTFGGATDYEVDRLFVSDATGNIISSLDVSVSYSGISIKQYQLTKDYELIISQLVFTSPNPIPFDSLISSNIGVQAYRLDTTYNIINGKFVKEGEAKYPTKTYTQRQMIDRNTWDL